ncbi:hypothetical protein A3B42_03595 [Candidatus Daviesbacteria bacterium RIFCSPLOWO2_01_FULL_38_10]|nr:MAG: hypothetical protein A3D02_01555 [Candidatus Daviesbacteria bacterium RIFCSPHIGHO2_02_FULL_39_41]OGE39498.1 MAG: hypothetical protein A3B42_03595 [Candidatus Daviesbacteria bacterium RIFCSPLOWO2_01_FULL_38_10]OGE45079.1 MAG: hypothetical protein A3E67_03960 [Candidatus Daviesbacteria bacterium RIFCSPHIGHO2_12_FULL_38_25]
MLPTLKPGQEVLTFNWGKVKVGDVVVVKSAKLKVQSEIIKRVQKIIDNKVYLVGDNKTESTDSRHFGPVDQSQITGKVLYYFHDATAAR